MWPTWTWVTKPHTRWFYASYDQELSTRDSLKCRALIQGAWYHGLWYDRYKFVHDQNEKTKFQNDKGGYRLATSVGGHGTGEHPDFICFPGDTLVSTPHGKVRIDRVGTGDLVMAADPDTGNVSVQTVVGTMRRRFTGVSVNTTLSDGTVLRCTPEHPIWSGGRWVAARELQRGMEVAQDGAVLGSVAVADVAFERYDGDVFNLEVSDTATYFANRVLVHNCIDDPHNVKKAESEANRKAVLNWWTLTMATRGVSRKAARVIIMQRLHQSDLSGHILANDEYEHLCLPMRYEHGRMKTTVLGFNDPRTEEGELLTPNQFDDKTVKEIERNLGAYGSAGQLQQRPAPKEGGLFRTSWFEIIPAAPEMLSTVRWWDFAATEYEGDYTCGGKMGRSRDGKYVIMNIRRGQWSSAERDRTIKSTAMRDGHGTHQWCEQEPGSAGKTVAENFVKMLDGYTARFEPTRGDKIRNAEPLASQAEVGSIYVVADTENDRWNTDLFEEFELFPFGEHDDIVDAISKAFNKLSAMSHAVIDVSQLRYYEQRSNILTRLHVARTDRHRVSDETQCQRVMVVKCGAGDPMKPRKVPWSCCQLWDYDHQAKDMFLRFAWRERMQWGELCDSVKRTQNEWRPKRTLIIHDDVGARLFHDMRGNSELVNSVHGTTLELSVTLQDMIREERVLLSSERSDWRDVLESEWLAWTGSDDDEDSHVITAAYAAKYWNQRVSGWGGTVAGEPGRQTVPFTAHRF